MRSVPFLDGIVRLDSVLETQIWKRKRGVLFVCQCHLCSLGYLSCSLLIEQNFLSGLFSMRAVLSYGHCVTWSRASK
jgi:hypothetical protein